jgi:hypothetical protein
VMIEHWHDATPEATTGVGRTQSEVVPTNMPRVLRTPPSSYQGETTAGGFAGAPPERFHGVYKYGRAAGSVCVLSALQYLWFAGGPTGCQLYLVTACWWLGNLGILVLVTVNCLAV